MAIITNPRRLLGGRIIPLPPDASPDAPPTPYQRYARRVEEGQGKVKLDLSKGGTGGVGLATRTLDVYQKEAIEPLAARATYGAQKLIPGTQEIEEKTDRGVNVTDAYRSTRLPFAVKGLTELAVDPANLLFAGTNVGRTATKSAVRGAKGLLVEPRVGIAAPADPAVAKLTNLVKSAKPVLAEQQVERTAELGRRVGFGREIAKQGPATGAGRRSLAALKNPLPKASFTPPESGLAPSDIESLFQLNRAKSLDTDYFKFINTEEALGQLLAGSLPTKSQIKLLEETYGTELAELIMKKRPLSAKVWDEAASVANLPRALQAGVDFSAPGRQGLFLAPRHPKEFFGAFKPMVKAWNSEEAAQSIDDVIRSSPRFRQAEDAGLYFAPLRGVGAGLAKREEAFMTDIASRVGLLRKSERAYISYLNKLRFDTFSNVVHSWEKAGKKFSQKEVDDLADFLNKATGRGKLEAFGKSLDDLAPVLNATFFSPKLLISRPQTLMSAITAKGLAGKEARQAMGAFFGTGIGILGMLKASGAADVEMDPRSSDFGKVRVGPTRYDFWASFQPLARYAAQIMTGDRKAISSGETQNVSRLGTAGRFVRSKLAPVPSLITDFIRQENFFGENVSLDSGLNEELARTITPIVAQSIYEGMKEEGLLGGIKVLPEGLGAGTATFYPTGDKFQDAERERLVSEIPEEGLNQKRGEALRQSTRQEQREFREGNITTARQIDEDELKQATGARKQTLGIKLQRLDDEAALEEELAAGKVSRADFRKRFDEIQSRSATDAQQVFADFNLKDGKPPTDPKERAVYDYYKAYEQSRIPGGLDFDRLETLLAGMDSRWTDEIREYVSAQTGQTEHHTPLAQQIAADKKALRDSGYWDVADRLPALNIPEIRIQYEEYIRSDPLSFGFKYGAGALSRMRNLDRQKTQIRERMRAAEPELDEILIRWGYVTQPKTARGRMEALRNAGVLK